MHHYIQMKSLIVFGLLLSILLAQQAGPVVYYVSGSPNSISNPVYSSLRGGRLIYIKVTGHSLMASENQVFVGATPCIIPSDGVTDTFISCETTDIGSDIGINSQAITVISNSVAFTTAYPNVVHFNGGSTAQLNEIFPSSGYANKQVHFYGVHRITDLGNDRVLGDIKELKLGGDLCGRFDIFQEAIDANANAYIKCVQSGNQVAGKYNVSEKVTPGRANNNPNLRRASFDEKEYYQFAVLPTITSVSPNTGNLGGQNITISGTGFSAIAKNNTVSVNGNDCKVSSSSQNTISCTINAYDSTKTTKLATTSSAQQKGYFSGAGLKYSRYTTLGSNDLTDFAKAIRLANATFLGTAAEVGVRAELKEGDAYGAGPYGQAWSGYFTAPADGVYTFRGIADDRFQFFLATVPGSAELPTNPLIYSNTYQPNWNNFYIDDSLTAESTATLQAGKSYYIQAYHINTHSSGSFKIQVDIPNTNVNLPFQTYQIHKLITQTSVQPEVVRYTMTGATSGSINMKLVRKDKTGAITYNVNKTVDYGCSETAFQNALNGFNSFSTFYITVTRIIFDSGNVAKVAVTDASDIIQYEVSIYKKRTTEYENEDFTYSYINCVGSITKTSVTSHSPLLTGSFSFTIGGQLFDNIPYNASAGSIQTSLRTIVGYEKVIVESTSKYGAEYSTTWVIRYVGVNSAIPSFVPNSAGLSGGINSPTVVLTVRRPYAPSVTINPIDFRFLNTAASGINVFVKTNDIPALCNGDCGYTFFDKFRITSLSKSGATLSLAISNPTSVSVTQSSVSILVQGLPCTITGTFDLSSLTCTLTKNTDNSPLLIAGDVTPQVYIAPYGLVGLDDGVAFTGRRLLITVTPITVPLVTSSMTKTTGGDNGGYLNTIVGSGFPLDKSQITVSLCGKDAIIQDVNNIQVIFYVPSCDTLGSKTVTVTVGAITSTSLSYSYTSGASSAPIISSISPNSLNPGLKKIMTITGSGFGIDASVVSVYLTNSTGKIYTLKVLSLSDTTIKVGLSGGLPGTFTVQVSLASSSGDSVPATIGADQFSYVVKITSISPTTGSYYGGTLLTLTGVNFSPAYLDTIAYVGETLNNFCLIESITETEIKCRTPEIDKAYLPGQPEKLLLETKLIVPSTCPGNNCDFFYMTQANSPKLDTISKTIVNAEALSVTGTNFISVTTCSISLRSKINSSIVFQVATTACDAVSANFTVPKTIPTGPYIVRVRNEIGESNGKQISVSWSVGTPTFASGGSIMGNRVTYSGGSGYPTALGKGYNVYLLSGNSNVYPINLISCCADNKIVFEIPPITDGSSVTITFQSPFSTNKRPAYKPQPSLTPNISIPQGSPLPPGLNTITFTRMDSLTSTPITAVKLVSTIDKTNEIIINDLTNVSTTFSFTADLKSGSYHVKALTKNGYAMADNTINVSMTASASVPAQTTSFAGGSITITGSNLSPSSFILVNSLRGNIKSYTSSAVTYEVPALVTPLSQSTFNIKKVQQLNMRSFVFSSDIVGSFSNVSAAFDGEITTIYGSSNPECWIEVDVGAGLQAVVDRVRFFPFLDWVNTANYTLDGVFEASNDDKTWTLIGKIDQTVHSGWNVIRSITKNSFRYFRFRHTSQSQCNLAQFQLYGYIMSQITASMTSQLSNVIYNDGFNTQTFTNKVEYKTINTPTVLSVNPPYGDIFGGYLLTITGTNFDASITVVIDGVPCVYVSSNSTQVNCTVGARPTIPAKNTFEVSSNGNKAIIVNSFLYVLKWSDSRTWGVDAPPVEGDLVYVPPGMTLLIDQDTPILLGIAVQKGALIFPNDTTKSVTVRTGFITLNGGQFIAGTESAPLYSNLTFIMYGNYYGRQQPMFGNKGIGCMDCKFSMYGRPRKPTWTTISATINPAATTLTVTDDVDWKVGQTIVVASTSFFHYEAEERVITAISGKTITVDKAFVYKHVSVVQNLGAKDKLTMRAEVGLLSRNIKMMGDPTSVVGKYGSHLMLSGMTPEALEGQVAYSEFTHCGQPQILGRYCIHFHMAKQVPTSFVRGNAVHESFARVVTIHGVYQLTVEDNVGYRVRGHNFFIQDGIETHNVIRNNLAISSLTVTNMLQTDISVASFWVTNPTNDFYGNHAAGGDFYGFWYEIKPNPDGPSATNDVCPTGNPLGYVANNVAHSYIRFGLRVFQLFSRRYPCQSIRNDSNAADPWASNPSIPSVFYNFTIYKNLQSGVLSEQSGNIQFQNFTIAQNYRAGVQFYLANFTREMVSVDNSIIVGKTISNPSADGSNYTKSMAGVITPRTGQTNITNTRFYYYPTGSIAFITCAHCDDLLLYTNKGSDTFIKNLTFTGVDGNYLFMIGMKRDVIYDLDGSLSGAFDGGSRTSATIFSNFAHIGAYNQDVCTQSTNPAAWDNAYMCDQSVTIRRVYFTNMMDPYTFSAQFMKAVEISTIEEVVDPEMTADQFTAVQSRQKDMQPKKQKPNTWSLPFITGRMYQIWWGTGMDFEHMSIEPSKLLSPTDQGIIFKFNYTFNRESFKIGPMRGGLKLTAMDYITQSSPASAVKPSTCTNGQYYHNNDNSSLRMLEICISGRQKTTYEYMQVNAVVCEFLCPAPPGTFQKQNFIRLWSNASQWPNNMVPKAGDNVTVNGNWTVLLDIDPNPANYMIIDGTIILDDTRDVLLTARSIFIRSGNITAGTATKPFLHKFTIQINNTKQDHGWFIDEVVAGNKYLVVTGSLSLYGNAPGTVQTFLTAPAKKDDTKIHVKSSTDWAVGDILGISPSYGKYSEYEKVAITAINADGSVDISPALQFNHYGSSGPFTAGSYGNIDLNTYVAHLNRNIEIIPGPDVGWGVNVLVYGYTDQDDVRRDGYVALSGVQIQDGGQYDTTASALQFLNVQNKKYTSIVEKSSFVNCKAWCINVDTVRNVTIHNNVFYNAWVFGIRAFTMVNFEFTNNLLIGVTARPTIPFPGELVACFATYEYIAPADNVKVNNNFCLGSQGHGFAVPHIKCSELQTNPFRDNTVGSAQIGYIFNNIDAADGCKGFSYAKAYGCQIGQICGPGGSTSIHFDNFIMVDNQRGVTLKMGGSEGTSNHTALFTNSYVSAVSRPTCADCYGTGALECSNNVGVRAFSASANGQHLPKKFGPGFDVICKQQLFETKAYLTNVTFDNFKQTYTSTSVQAKCSQNFAFRPHSGAHDATGDHNLFDVHCTNCDTNSYLYAEPNHISELGWFGGCGDIICTGKSNYLIIDWNGSFLGFKGTIIPNNTVIAANEPGCVDSIPMNAHICTRTDLAVLVYQSVAPDFQTRIMWPVNLTYEGSNYTTVTNGWREWQWMGKQPLNKRFGRFVSIVKLNSTYNLTYTAMPPVKMQFQIQKRTPKGDNDNYVIAKMHYPLPNMIQIKVNGIVKDPVLITDSGLKRPLDKKVCGDNAYFYTNYTTHFVVTEDHDCFVELSLTETVQLTTHFAMSVNDFFTGNTMTNFISSLCALLGVTDTSRVKVVGVINGSAIVTTTITPSTNTNDPTPLQIDNKVKSNANAIVDGLGGAVGQVLGVGSSHHADPSISVPNQSILQDSSSIGLIVGISVGAVVVAITLVVVFCYFLRKRAKIVEEIRQSEEEPHEKEGDKENYMINHDSHFDVKQGSHTSEFKLVQGASTKVNVRQHENLDD